MAVASDGSVSRPKPAAGLPFTRWTTRSCAFGVFTTLWRTPALTDSNVFNGDCARRNRVTWPSEVGAVLVSLIIVTHNDSIVRECTLTCSGKETEDTFDWSVNKWAAKLSPP